MESKKKNIIIINGKGGVGKDSLIENATKLYNVWNVSSIDPIKKLALNYGYKESEKTEKARKFLSNLKSIFSEWNNLSLNYILESTKEFILNDSSDIMFIHIREPEEIEKYKNEAKKIINDMMENVPYCIKISTLLVTRECTDNKVYNNKSDDNVENYKYDFTFNNCKPLNISKHLFLAFLEEYIL